MKEKFAYAWCQLNDPESWYHRKWQKDEIWGAMKIIEQLIGEKTCLIAWNIYHAEKSKRANLWNKIKSEMVIA